MWIIADTASDDAAGLPELEAWAATFQRELQAFGSGTYVSFMGDEGPAAVTSAYPSETWARLREVKRRYDPGNLFRRNQNIPPAASADEIG